MATSLGADACQIVTPYYNKPTQEGLYRHYRTISEAVSLPILLYNVPSRTGCDLWPNTIARLRACCPQIIGVKEATGQLERVQAIRDCCGDDFDLFSGDDATALEFILKGGQGVISVTANVVPLAMHALCESALKGEVGAAGVIHQRLMELHRALFVETNPIPVKWALHRLGRIQEGIRLPLVWLTDASRRGVLEQSMDKAIRGG